MFLPKSLIIGQFNIISKLTALIETSEQKFAMCTCVRQRQ